LINKSSSGNPEHDGVFCCYFNEAGQNMLHFFNDRVLGRNARDGCAQDKKKKEEYTKKYNKLEMVSNSKGKGNKELELELKRFKGLKNKENKNGINK
jgi:hypothetical protein